MFYARWLGRDTASPSVIGVIGISNGNQHRIKIKLSKYMCVLHEKQPLLLEADCAESPDKRTIPTLSATTLQHYNCTVGAYLGHTHSNRNSTTTHISKTSHFTQNTGFPTSVNYKYIHIIYLLYRYNTTVQHIFYNNKNYTDKL